MLLLLFPVYHLCCVHIHFFSMSIVLAKMRKSMEKARMHTVQQQTSPASMKLPKNTNDKSQSQRIKNTHTYTRARANKSDARPIAHLMQAFFRLADRQHGLLSESVFSLSVAQRANAQRCARWRFGMSSISLQKCALFSQFSIYHANFFVRPNTTTCLY